MRRALFVLLTAAFLLSCSDADAPSGPDGQELNNAILDGTGTSADLGDDPDLQANEFFFWLEPMVDQPDQSQLGTFDPEMRPTVQVVCWESTQLAEENCNPEDGPPVVVAEFTVGNGLVVETDHYKVDFDTDGLQTSSSEDFTTYRILALTPPLTLFGGPFVFGLADFQLGENGKEARNLDSSETIGLTDGRTLPIRFRLDEGALEEELAVNTAPTDDPTGDRAFCRINCSVTVIDQDEDTEASLFDPDTGDEISAAFIPSETVWTDETAVYVIDELVDDGDTESGELCLPSGEIPTEACYRHELSPDNPNGDDFQQNTDGELPRAGVCPTSEDQALVSNGSASPTWRFLKADEVDGEVKITRPPEVSVSDFLQCDIGNTMTLWDGPGGQLAGTAVQWLVPPLRASDTWGGQLQDLSDLFMGEDVEMTREDFPSSATEGTTLQMTVQLTAVHDGTTPSDRTVTFTPTAGTGALTAGAGFTDQDSDPNTVTLETDGSGQATVDWEITEGSNRLEATSPHAELANANPDVLAFAAGAPAVFEVTGTASVLAFVANRGDDNVAVIESNTVTTTIPVGDAPVYFTFSPDESTLYVSNELGGTVSVIDVATNAVDATIPETSLGSSPNGMAVTPDGATLYVTNLNSDDVSVIDASNNSLVTTLAVGDRPTDAVVVPNGSRAYVSNLDSDDVSIIDVGTNSVRQSTISAGTSPIAVALRADSDTTLYVANRDSDDLSVIDVTNDNNQLSSTIAVGDRPLDVAVTPDGNTLYVVNEGSGDVTVIDAINNAVVTTIDVGTGSAPQSVAFNDDGTRAYVVQNGNEDVQVIDVAASALLTTIPVGTNPIGIAVRPPSP